MTTEMINPTEWNALKELAKYVARQIRRNEGIIKSNMEALIEDFTENFEWKSETIYKAALKLEYLIEVHKLSVDERCNVRGIRCYLCHTIEHKTDDLLHGDPFGNSTNEASNLTHRWKYESDKEIISLARRLLEYTED